MALNTEETGKTQLQSDEVLIVLRQGHHNRFSAVERAEEISAYGIPSRTPSGRHGTESNRATSWTPSSVGKLKGVAVVCYTLLYFPLRPACTEPRGSAKKNWPVWESV